MKGTRPLNVYVSAASRGLGFEIARRLMREGARIAISSRSPEKLTAACSLLRRDDSHTEVLPLIGDLARVEDQQAILEGMDAQGFSPDVFVCSAGQPPDARLSTLTRAQWDDDLEMILGQAVFASQHLVPPMAARGYGRVIFISSSFAKMPDASFLTSSVARAGLFALSRAITSEYASDGVACFVLCLGFVDTPLLRNMALQRDWDGPDPAAEPGTTQAWLAQYEQWAGTIPARRIGSAAELAETVTFLVSPAADYLNGSVLSFAGALDKGLF